MEIALLSALLGIVVAAIVLFAWRPPCGEDAMIDGLIRRNAANHRRGMESTDWRRIGQVGEERWDEVMTAQLQVARATSRRRVSTAVGGAVERHGGRGRRGLPAEAAPGRPDSIN